MAFVLTGAAAEPAPAPAHDYPTIARVEYVNECIGKNGGKLAALYQCSCAIDRIANALAYDDYVEASTYAKYADLAGPGRRNFPRFGARAPIGKEFSRFREGCIAQLWLINGSDTRVFGWQCSNSSKCTSCATCRATVAIVAIN